MERNGETLEFVIERERLDDGGVGPIGVESFAASSIVGVADEEGLAARAGVRTGDRIVAVNGVEVADRYGLAKAIGRADGALELDVRRSLGTRKSVYC